MSDPSLPANVREFHCNHCNGKIRIPKDLPPTTGPCPHCQGVITSPPPESTPPAAFLPPAPVGYGDPQAPVRTVAPLPIPSGPVEAPQAAPAPAPTPPQADPGIPAVHHEPVQAPVESAAPVPQPLPQRRSSAKSETHAEPKKSVAPVIALSCLLLAFAAGAGYVVFKEMKNRETKLLVPAPSVNSAMAESQYMRIGWQKEAYGVLEKFLAAKTAEAKIPYIIDGERLKPQVEAFYGGSVINDQDTPADAFSVNDLTDEDKKRGIFMLTFDQPPQFEMKEFFRPLASLEVQYGLNEADLLLSTMARVGNFATEPVRISAFFKKTPQGLKLDWETFAQTKYRTFQTLVELPEAGQGGVFRIVISEDVPETGRALAAGVKTYRMWDPASPEASARVNVNIDSEIGRTLSKIDWRGKENRPVNSTATVELKWVGADQPKLEITRFICWEFLHLGGSETASPAR